MKANSTPILASSATALSAAAASNADTPPMIQVARCGTLRWGGWRRTMRASSRHG